MNPNAGSPISSTGFGFFDASSHHASGAWYIVARVMHQAWTYLFRSLV